MNETLRPASTFELKRFGKGSYLKILYFYIFPSLEFASRNVASQPEGLISAVFHGGSRGSLE
jgi:hypothetical protein